MLRPLAELGLDQGRRPRPGPRPGPSLRRQASRAVSGLPDPALRRGHAGEAARRSTGPKRRWPASDSPTSGSVTTATSPGSNWLPTDLAAAERAAARSGRWPRYAAAGFADVSSTPPDSDRGSSPSPRAASTMAELDAAPDLAQIAESRPRPGRASRFPRGRLLRREDAPSSWPRSPRPCATGPTSSPCSPARTPSRPRPCSPNCPRRSMITKPGCWPGRATPPEPTGGLVVVVTAGTSDLPVAKEALLTAQYLGRPTELVVDVGVAGLHRVLDRLPCSARRGDHRRRRDGRRAAECRRRPGVRPGGRACRPRSGTAPPSVASLPCSRCSTPARPAWRWSTSTTGTGPATSRRRSPPA